MNLPHHRRYQWRIMAKHNKPALYGLLVIAILIALFCAYDEYMTEHNLRVTRENEIRDLLRNHYSLTTFGAPGTKTDFQEGTERMDR